MLVVSARGGGKKKYQYGGSGIFAGLTKNIFQKSFKNAISAGAQSAIGQRIADAFVNGSTSATKKAVEDTVNTAINKAKSYTTQKVLKRKQEGVEPIISSSKKPKININTLINGSGIVLD